MRCCRPVTSRQIPAFLALVFGCSNQKSTNIKYLPLIFGIHQWPKRQEKAFYGSVQECREARAENRKFKPNLLNRKDCPVRLSPQHHLGICKQIQIIKIVQIPTTCRRTHRIVQLVWFSNDNIVIRIHSPHLSQRIMQKSTSIHPSVRIVKSASL